MAGSSQPKVVDDPSTKAMITQFNDTMAMCDSAHSAVHSASADLMSRWGGAAATKYNQSIEQWLEGLRTVHGALMELLDSMAGYSKVTTGAEQVNVSEASW